MQCLLLIIPCKAFSSQFLYIFCLLVSFSSMEDFLRILICFTGFLPLPSFSSIFTSVYFFSAFSLVLSLFALERYTSATLSFAFPPFMSSLLYFIRNFTLSSHILYFSDLFSHLSVVLFYRLPLGIPVFFVSSGPFPHS